ncbi:SH3 domain-containing protein [Blautia wexlerae]|uniref:SH3 domain-containing protein n=1 Tax=Blautia wexlerae TaxID=418240 RepID=UPI001FAE3605|nr:SH3 domain-containing protein [Blautia wexlerae]
MDDFREWLSDNLRYFMLGGVILIIVVVLFCGIRACSGSNKGNSGDEQKTTSEDQGNVPSSPTSEGESDEKKEDANPMETADADVTALIKSYYQALGEKDIATLKTLEDDFTPSDESKVTNLKDYIEGYEVGDVYTKKGMTDDSYVVYACFSYICQGVETKAPALTQFYVYKNSGGSWVIDNGALQDSEISAYMEKQLSDSDVSALVKKVQNELDQAQQSDPSLAEFLNGLGEEADVSTNAEDGTMLTTTDECNVRAEASTDADILGVISAGEQVEKTGTDGEWVQIDYDGETGYIRGDLLE